MQGISVRKTFISVKYFHDSTLERMFSCNLRKHGIEVYYHEGTVDLVKRAAPSPAILEGDGISVVSPKKSRRLVEPPPVTPGLQKQLFDLIWEADAVLVIWTECYSQSLWTMLELQIAITLNKPILLVRADSNPIKEALEIGLIEDCDILDIDKRFRLSSVTDSILGIAARRPFCGSREVALHEIDKFVQEFKKHKPLMPILTDSEIIRYEELLANLLTYHTSHKIIDNPMREAIEYYLQRGDIDQNFRIYLEAAGLGLIRSSDEHEWVYGYMLGEILDYKFLHPTMPIKMRTHIEERIASAFRKPLVPMVEELINDSIESCLYTREFVEYFGFLLKRVVKEHGKFVADQCWQICVSRISDAV